MMSFRPAFPFFLVSLLAAILVGFHPARSDAGVSNPETFMLDNGLQVVVVSQHRAPVVTHMVWYKVGSADEEDGKSGIAHLFEHLMFKGTKTYPAGEFSRRIAENGGRENAFTSYDYTGYYQTVAKDRLDMVMRFEADRMRNLILTQRELDTERNVVLEERRSRVENNPSAILSEAANAALYMNHPYRRPVIGWEHELKALSVDDIRGFYDRWYRPENAIVVVAGDITAADVRPLAERHYGAVLRGAGKGRAHFAEPPQRAERTVELKDERVRQPSWSKSVLVAGYATARQNGHANTPYIIEVLSDILGGGGSSLLYRALAVDRQSAVSVGSYHSLHGRGPGRFGLYASPIPGVTLDMLATEIETEIAAILKRGITADEVARAKRRLLAGATYARDSISTAARALGGALAVGQAIEDVERWPERIQAVTAEQVNAEARALFARSGWVTSRLLPNGEGER